jgi:hypothetical protein
MGVGDCPLVYWTRRMKISHGNYAGEWRIRVGLIKGDDTVKAWGVETCVIHDVEGTTRGKRYGIGIQDEADQSEWTTEIANVSTKDLAAGFSDDPDPSSSTHIINLCM